MNAETSTTPASRFDALVIGAGVSGLYALHRLRDTLARKVRVLEAGADVGGTWYWNRYPGCRCDVESLEYSFSFDAQLEQDWRWPERYGNQPEILDYLRHVAERFDLRKDIQFDSWVDSAIYDRATTLWTVTTAAGQVLQAPICIMATGNLSIPRVPDIPGLASFQGETYHTGLWPHEGVDFTGKRVAVFATGFDAMTGALKEIDIRTSDGRSLSKDWEAGPYTMLGIMCAGFPNMFMVTGPGSPGVKSQMILSCEQHVAWITACLRYMEQHGHAAIEPSESAQHAWTMHVKEVADATLYPRAASWYMGANIPGKPRVFMPYVGGVHVYTRTIDEVAARGYEGFRFTPAARAEPDLAMAGDD